VKQRESEAEKLPFHPTTEAKVLVDFHCQLPSEANPCALESRFWLRLKKTAGVFLDHFQSTMRIPVPLNSMEKR